MESLAHAFSNSPLVELELSDNALGERGLTRLTPLLNGHSLQRIYLSNCGLSLASMETLRDAVLGNEGKMAKTLEEIVLDRNMIGVQGAAVVREFLKECTNLQLISYRGCRPDREGTKYICQALDELTAAGDSKLRHIDMDDTTIGSDDDSGVVPLSKALSRSRWLTYLKIPDGGLQAEGMQMVADALQESDAKLTYLHLGECFTFTLCSDITNFRRIQVY